MPNTIIKRSGEQVDFDATKISTAISKAFAATTTEVTEQILKKITDSVTSEVEKRFTKLGLIGSVEQVQDIVEKQIDKAGYFEVAKAYILYRYQQLKAREGSVINVIKRNGEKVDFNIEEIYTKFKQLTNGFDLAIDQEQILKEVKASVYDGITTQEIDRALIMVIRSRIERDPVFSRIAARGLNNLLYKDVLGLDEFTPGFEQAYKASLEGAITEGLVDNRYDARMKDFDFAQLAEAISYNRDQLLDYLGAETLYDRYYMKNYASKVLELPQVFWMRVAMGLSLLEENKEQKAIEFYHLLSQLYYIASTPTLFHSGTAHPQMSSCYLNYVSDDLNHIFQTYQDHAQLSKWSGGIGTSWSAIRGTGSLIKTTNVSSQGVIPFLKIADSTTAAINRSGKRRGAAAVYLETWHFDIEHFLDLRKNTGDDRRRTHDMNTVNWIPDLFMKRVQENGQWTLFSTDETPELHDIFGKEFERVYTNYEKLADEGKIKIYKRVDALTMWRKMISMLFETGHPWMTFKDPCNIRSPQDHVGVVHSSNLCTEITLNTSKDETAVCNLGSINLARHVVNGKMDWALLGATAKLAIRMLDNVIDLNYYPTTQAETSNMKHRPVGLGIMGMQDALFMLDINFDSDESVEWNDEMMEYISYQAIEASSDLAKERAPYSSFKGSKWDRGIFPLDTLKLLEDERGLPIDVNRDARLDWESLKKKVKKQGMRNSNTMAIAPTATISTIVNVFPSIEAPYKNLYVKANQTGDFTVINEYLVTDLKREGLWTSEMVNYLKYYDGNIQNIPGLSPRLKAKYKEAFEIDPIWTLKQTAVRGKWMDQSQSVNIFTATTSGKALNDIYFNAWNMGLKTTYYLRTMAASSIEKSTMDINKKIETPTVEVTIAAPIKIPVPANMPNAEELANAAPTKACLIADPDCEACQ
jgi:ribonucleoside-diphosphate reductase alpha chain